jgi:predicted O-methyltransferase YrrM
VKLYPESEYTKPREDCPHPEWWHATDCQSTEVEVSELIGSFVRALQPEYVVETGTCAGITAHMIGLALEMNEHGVLDTIEYDAEMVKVAQRLCMERTKVRINHISSLKFEPVQNIDMLFLDSELDLRVAEFHRFKPWLNPGAVIMFHDTGPHKDDFGKQVQSIEGLRWL